MARLPLVARLMLSSLALAACSDSATLTQTEASGDRNAASETLVLASNTWTPRAPMADPRSGSAVAAAQNAVGQWIVYVFGGAYIEDGETGFGGVKYNVETDTWSSSGGSSFVRAVDMNGAAKVGNKLYFTGGESCCDITTTFNKTWAFDLGTQRLLTKANMPRATKYGVSGGINGRLYVLPGYCSGEATDPGHCQVGQPTRVLYRYDPPTNTWSLRRSAPHFHTFGGAAVIENKFYVVGGSAQGPYLDVYDPATDTWQTRAPIPTAGERLFAAPLLKKLFVLSWSHPNGGPVVLKAYLYDPATNKWTSRGAPPGVAGPIVNVKGRLFMPGIESSYLYTP